MSTEKARGVFGIDVVNSFTGFTIDRLTVSALIGPNAFNFQLSDVGILAAFSFINDCHGIAVVSDPSHATALVDRGGGSD